MSETKTFEDLFLSQSEEENLKVNRLKILIINNINSNYLYLIKLKEWQIQHQEYFDYLLYLGNFLSFKEDKDKNDLKEISNDEAEIGALLSYMENLSLNIIYIGGNNDTPTIFKTPYPALTLRSLNLHDKFHKLAEDLYLIGYGGDISIDTFDNSLEKTFNSFNDYIKENEITYNIQTILLSNGDILDMNNLLNQESEIIYENILKNNKIFINLSGNIKKVKGTSKINDTTLINPGSISEGELAILILERDKNNKKWQIEKIDYIII